MADPPPGESLQVLHHTSAVVPLNTVAVTQDISVVQHRAATKDFGFTPFLTKMFQKCQILRNFVQNFQFLPLFWLFLTQIKAFLPQGKKYRPTEMVSTNLSGSPDTESQVKFFS